MSLQRGATSKAASREILSQAPLLERTPQWYSRISSACLTLGKDYRAGKPLGSALQTHEEGKGRLGMYFKSAVGGSEVLSGRHWLTQPSMGPRVDSASLTA